MPDGIDEPALRAAVRERYGVAFSSGRGETLGKLLRIGHMGPTAQPIYAVLRRRRAGRRAQSLGHRADVGAGVGGGAAIDGAQ